MVYRTGHLLPASLGDYQVRLTLGMRSNDLKKTLRKVRKPIIFRVILGAKVTGFSDNLVGLDILRCCWRKPMEPH